MFKTIPSFLVALAGCIVFQPAAHGALTVGYDIKGTADTLNPLGSAETKSLLSVGGGAAFNFNTAPDLTVDGLGTAADYIELGFSDTTGTWDLSTFDFVWLQPGGSGVTTLQLQASSNKNSTFFTVASGLGQNTAHNLNLASVGDLQGITSASFRLLSDNGAGAILLYGQDAGAGAFQPFPGTNLAVQGAFTAVPEPTALGLLSTLGAVALFRRRRS